MRRTLHAPHSPLPDDRSGLGHEHPFVRATEQVTVAIDRCVAVSALLVVGVLALIDGLAVGPPLAFASATVLVARAERLVIDGGSALYGSSEEALRQELGHIRFLLAS